MQPPRTPPAFIPTLTRELDMEQPTLHAAPLLIDVPLLDDVLPAAPAPLQPSISLLEPSFASPRALSSAPVPPPLRPFAPMSAAPIAAAPASAAPRPVLPPVFAQAAPPVAPAQPAPNRGLDDSRQQAEQLKTRLLQRVDVILQRRVREAAAAVALEHAQNMLKDLQPAIERAVHEAVSEALEMELSKKS